MPSDEALRRVQAVSIALLLVLSIVQVVGPALGATVSGSQSQQIEGIALSAQSEQVNNSTAQTETENDSTVVHEDPQRVSDEDNRAGLQRWLADRMTEVIIDCTEQARVGSSYACDQLDNEYPDWASRYVEVRRESSNEEIEEDTLNRTQRDAQQFLTQVEQFRDLEAEYREAKDNGDEQRARELAHQLLRESRRLNFTGNQLTADYTEFANATEVDLDPATDDVAEIQTNTTSRATEIRETELVATELTATVDADTGSFASPFVVEGRLSAADGAAISERDVRFRIGNSTVTTQVDSDGQFSLRYRPISESLGRQTLSVRYIPENTSLYGPSEDQITVDIYQTGASVSVTQDPSTVAYNESLQAAGRVLVNGDPAGEVPVLVSLGDTRLGSVITNESGYYSLSDRLPAGVPTGESRVVAQLAFNESALVADAAVTTVQIQSTPTTLSLRANRLGSRSVNVTGQLLADERPVADRAITLSYRGTTLETIETGPEGRYNATISLPDSVTALDNVTLTATYSGREENLESAISQTNLTATESRSSGGLQPLLGSVLDFVTNNLWSGIGNLSPLAILGVAVVILFAGIIAFASLFLNRLTPLSWLAGLFKVAVSTIQGDRTQAAEDPATEKQEPEAEMVEPVPDDIAPDDNTLIAAARTQFSNGNTDDAVIMAYEAVRGRLIQELGYDSSITHGEMLQAYSNGAVPERANALHRLTEAYERAAFSLHKNSRTTTRAALAGGMYLLDSTDSNLADERKK